jgi:mono/diheme cytochrome c family protein
MWRPAAAVFLLTTLTAAAVGAIQVRERDDTWSAPADAAELTNPLADRPETAAGGRKLYVQRCANCHGPNGEGSPKAPDLTLPAVQRQSDGALFWKISSGNSRAGMPAFSYLPTPQRWQLVVFLRTLRSAS